MIASERTRRFAPLVRILGCANNACSGFLPDCKQKRSLARQERMGGDLACEAGGPATGNWSGTLGTVAIRGEAVIFDQVAVALDQRLLALRTARVFPRADQTGKIASIDVAKTRLAADFAGSQQVFRVRVAGIGHFVVAVKGGDMPRNVGRDAGKEFGEAAQFVGGVVEAGDEKRDDLKPEAQVVEHLWSAVVVRHEAVDKPGGFGFFENGDRPFAGDERLVVGADQNP